jgi:plasmid stabilization system protein ParE
VALQIKWTQIALEDYRQIVEYLVQEWTDAVAGNFIELVDARLKTLSSFPFLGIASIKNPSIRSISLTKQNKLYYRISFNAIEVLNIFDTRQSPDKNKYD